MNSEFKPLIDELEKQREEVLNKAKVVFISLLFLFGIIFFYLLFRSESSYGIISLFLLILLFISSVFIYLYFQSRWAYFYKSKFVGHIVKRLFPDLNYFPDKFIPKDLYFKSRLFENAPFPDRYIGKDLLQGKIGQVSFMASYIHTEYETEHGDDEHKKTSYHTIFRGIFIIADFPKSFSSTTVVLPNKLLKLGPKKLERAKLEDPEFEAYFDVFTNDQIEARYILTPALMELIKKFQNKIKTQIRLSFIDSSIYVAIPTKDDLFQTPSFLESLRNLDINAKVEEYKANLLFMISIVDEFNLNRRLWR